ncbi:MAG: TrmH family RNA methyltransferase, partial [Cyanobacteria bacterium P01_E01_bin.34]
FNLSVSAAICLYDLTRKLRASSLHWQLSEREQKEITLRWYKKVVKHAETMQADFLSGLPLA